MEIVIKTAAAAMCGTLICALIKKTNPEMSMLLAMTTAVGIAVSAIAMLEPALDMYETLKKSVQIPDLYITPVLKCTGIGIAVKLTADLCRENAQTATATALELVGTVCALAAAMPIIDSMIVTVCGLV